MNPQPPYGPPRPGPPGGPGYYPGAHNLPGPPPMGPPGGMHGPPPGRPPPPFSAPSSFPQGGPMPPSGPVPSSLPPPRPQPRPAGPPPSLQPPGQATPPKPSGSTPTTASKPTPALRAAEPLRKLMASVTFIAQTVDNEFLDKLFAIFGPVKSMKRPQDPSTKAFKTFAFVEYETPEAIRVALRVLPNQTIDGQDIQVKPTNPTKLYLDWWEVNGQRTAPTTGEEEDGEAAIDEDAAEMEATEAVMDLVSRRSGGAGSGGGGGGHGRVDSRGDHWGGERGRSKGGDTDALIRGVANETQRAEDRQARLEREFEADRSRKERQNEKDRRRERKEVEDLMRSVRQAESDAQRERSRRAQRLNDMRERRQHALKQDNGASRRDEEEELDKWRTTARQERLREAEADEADRMRELEEEAQRRGAASAAAAASINNDAAAAAANGYGGQKGIDMNDSIMKAMMQQVSGTGAKANGADGEREPEGTGGGGWLSVGGGTTAAAAPAATAARAATPPAAGAGVADTGKAAATKKAFFGDASDENKPRPGAWVLEQRAKAAAEASAQQQAVAAADAVVARPDSIQERQAAFEAERGQLMERIPTSLVEAGQWKLRADALRLDSLTHYQQLQKRVAKYVHEVLPQDEEAIANEVLSRIKAGDSPQKLCEFCEFLGNDAEKFTLRVMRLLIAESEITLLRNKHGIAGA